MRRLAGGLLAVAFSLCLAAPAPARAQSEFPYDVVIEPDTRERASTTTLRSDHIVTITEKGTGAAPPESAKWAVFGQASNAAGGEVSEAFGCGDAHEHSLDVANGKYECTVFVDHGGDWIFTALIADRARPQVILAQFTSGFTLETTEVYTGDPDKTEIEGSVTEVAVLWGHGVSAAVWFLLAGALVALVVPSCRRHLTSFATYRLERRLDLIVKLTGVTTALTVGTGTYLLLNQTAYETPFSSSAIDERFLRPYGRPYFLVLAFKLALYALMIVATVPLVRAAWRQLRRQDAGSAGSAVHRPSTGSTRRSDAIWNTGAVLTAPVEAEEAEEAPPPTAPARTPMGVRVSALVVIVGLPVILFCVTLLKYFHELVEAARNAPL